MESITRGSQAALAGVGFLVGYGWTVFRWAAREGFSSTGEGARVFFSSGLPLACGYALLVAVFFWPFLPTARQTSLRVVVAPTAFTLSAILAAVGMELALRFVG